MNKISRNRKPGRPSRRKPKVLLIHGSDQLNVLLLEKLIVSLWRCTVVILNDLPGCGRTIIEKFEQEARGAIFAMALLTPDDFVRFKGRSYRQPRPNVTLELGWAYGRLGRSRVCILFKKGTHLPSDLHGVNRIDFVESVLEVSHQLQVELESTGELNPHRASARTNRSASTSSASASMLLNS